LRRRAPRRSPAIARPGIAFIAFDDAYQEIEKELAFPGSERCQDSFLGGQGRRPQLPTQALAGARSAKQSCPAVIRVHATLDQTRRFEPVNHLAGARGVDAKPRGQPALVEAWQINDCRKDRIFARGYAGRDDDLGYGAQADLVEASRQMRRHAMRWGHWILGFTAVQAARHGASQVSRQLPETKIVRI
jgi:hypothetical protein